MSPVPNSRRRWAVDRAPGCVVAPHHEADGHLVVGVEVGVVVAADRQGHQRPAGQRPGHLEAGGVHDPLGGSRRHQVLDTPLGGAADLHG